MQTRVTLVTGSLCAFILAAGCSTPKPGQMASTPRDKEVYTDKGTQAVQKETKQRVAILVKQDKIPGGREVADALDSTLTSVMSDFAFFLLWNGQILILS